MLPFPPQFKSAYGGKASSTFPIVAFKFSTFTAFTEDDYFFSQRINKIKANINGQWTYISEDRGLKVSAIKESIDIFDKKIVLEDFYEYKDKSINFIIGTVKGTINTFVIKFVSNTI